ncbi:MAG: hypothetical protein AB7P12_10150 [Alphaproteobacteria bacterium]
MDSSTVVSFPHDLRDPASSRRALLIGDFGNDYNLVIETASVLRRAGFVVDLVTNNPVSRKLSSIDRYTFVDNADDVPRVAIELYRDVSYDLVSPIGDATLMRIVRSSLSDDEKLALLPVTEAQYIHHIGSKIGLSTVFQREGIRTPRFAVAHDKAELNEKIEEVGFPAFVKIDFSGAGDGTFECKTRADVDAVGNGIHVWPVLIQEKIKGYEIDVSAFFQNGELVSFAYSMIKGTALRKYGPSSLRLYSQLGTIDPAIFDEMRRLGRAIGGHGFTNVSVIQGDDGHRYYFEADMRANAWVNAPRFFGDDPATRISGYFSNGATMAGPGPVHPEFPDQILIPYFSRIRLWELAINRYRSWSYLPDTDTFSVVFAIVNEEIKSMTRALVKPLVPGPLWQRLKQVYSTALRKLMARS